MSKKRQDNAHKARQPEHGVRFDVEDDAETLFRQAVDQIGSTRGKILLKDESPDRSVSERVRGKSKTAGPRPELKIDLHGMTLDEARRHVDDRINDLLVKLNPGNVVTINIVTGKGLNSGAGGSVLAREIPEWVRNRFARHILEMDESPADVQLGGIPLRGSFRIKVKG
jgi:DNA-nicking Smr family endonuclease